MLREIDEKAIAPAMLLLPMGMDSPRARVQMLATGLQETGLRYRRQHMQGPARGLTQFERGGGVRGVLEHPSTSAIAREVCLSRCITPDAQSAWEAMETDDVLCMAFTRLLLWSDPHKLPDDQYGGWLLYLRTWRPGRPRPDTWQAFYARAEDFVLRGVDS
jgi:hypothetical protein